MIDWEPIVICGVAAVVFGAWAYIAHRVFSDAAKIRRASTDASLSALKISGQDKNRPMDIAR